MEPEEEGWKKQIEKFRVVQKCPRCSELGLKYARGKIECPNCGFEQNMREI